MITPARRYLLLAPLALLALRASAFDLKADFGFHDFVVPEVDSHTFGINFRFDTTHQFQTGLELDLSLDVFVDHDVDHLDDDHIPVWWKSAIHSDKKLLDIGRSSSLSLVFDLNGMRNTVSSIEKQYKVFPGLRADFKSGGWRLSLQGAIGYYSMEIDDDLPRTFGYDREDLDHGDAAYALLAETTVPFGASCRLTAGFQLWAESSTWLQQQARLELGFKMAKTNELVFDAESNHYNLSVYDKVPPSSPGYQPVLPFSKDLQFRVSMRHKW